MADTPAAASRRVLDRLIAVKHAAVALGDADVRSVVRGAVLSLLTHPGESPDPEVLAREADVEVEKALAAMPR